MRGKAIATMALAALAMLALAIPFSYSQSQAPPPTIPYTSAGPLPSTFYCGLTGTSTDFSLCVAATIPLAMIGVLLSLTIVALAYVMGNVLDLPGLRNWYQTELKEAGKSALIAVSIFAVVAIIGSIAALYFASGTSVSQSQGSIITSLGGLYTTVIGTGNSGYLTEQINSATYLYYDLFGLYDAIGFAKSIELKVYFPFPLVPLYTVGSIDSGVSENLYFSNIVCRPDEIPPCGSITTDAGTMVSIILVALTMQRDILLWIVEAGLGILIPVGIVLRAFPFLRPLGGTLIGVGIGAAVVYPSLLLFLNMSVSNYIVPPSILPSLPTCATPAPLSFSALISNPSSLVSSYLGYAACTAYNDFAPEVVGSGSGFLAGSAGTLGSLNSMFPILNYIVSAQFIAVLVQFVLFILDIIIGVVITNDIISALGGFRPQMGIGRIRLV